MSASTEEPRSYDRERDGPLMEYDGFDDSLAFLAEAWQREGPFDGIFGFSQGAMLAAVFVMHPNYRELIASAKFACIVSGTPPRDPKFAEVLSEMELPSFHVYGEADEIVPGARSLELAEFFPARVVHSHPGGHALPSTAAKALREFCDAL